MRDVVYILITTGFFALCGGLIRACDAVIGPDDLDEISEVGNDPRSAAVAEVPLAEVVR